MFGGKKDEEMNLPTELKAVLSPQLSDIHRAINDVRDIVSDVRDQVSSAQKPSAKSHDPEGGWNSLESSQPQDASPQEVRPNPEREQAPNSESEIQDGDTQQAGQLAELKKENAKLKDDADRAWKEHAELESLKDGEIKAAADERDHYKEHFEQLQANEQSLKEEVAGLQDERDQYVAQLSSQNERVIAEGHKREELEGSLQQANQRLEQCQSDLGQAQNENRQKDARIGEYNLQVSKSNEFIAELESKVSQLEGQNGNLAKDKADLEEGKAGLLADKQRLNNQLLAYEKLDSLMWPKFLSQPDMLQWREDLQQEILQDAPNENVVLMTSCLYGYNAAARMGKDWQKRLIDILYDFSFAFFRWCQDTNVPAEEAVEKAGLWAMAFNANSEGLIKISVPEPDEPFDKRSMVSYEGGGGSSLDVKCVRSWGIQDENGRIMKQAEVTTQ